jgi:beta-xylosidase
MDCDIADLNQAAGLTAFYNKNNYMLIGKRILPDGQTAVFLERALGHINEGNPVLIATKVIEGKNKELQLKIKGAGRYYGFYYKTAGDKEWNILVDSVDTGMQIMDGSADFVGTCLGMYTSSGHFKR